MTQLQAAMAFTVASLLFVTLPARAGQPGDDDDDRWRGYASFGEGLQVYFDSHKLTRVSKNNIRFWHKLIFPENHPETRMQLQLLELHCTAKIVRSLQTVTVYANGDRNTVTQPSSWERIEPDSPFEELHDVVCKTVANTLDISGGAP